MDELLKDILAMSEVEGVTFAHLDDTGKYRCELTWKDGSVNRRSAKTPEAALRSVLRAQNLL